MSTHVTKAVIAAAGSGTRFLPTTLVVPKELIPVLDKPAIQWIVDELVASGITDILFIIAPGKESIQKYFSPHKEMERSLLASGKHALHHEVARVSQCARIEFAYQHGPYGNGTPLLCAKDFVGHAPFLYVWPDDLVLSDTPFAKTLIRRYEQTQSVVIGVDEVSWEEVSKYGVVDKDEKTDAIRGVIEKPQRENAPSNLVQFGRMVLTRDIISALEKTPLGRGNELWFADGLSQYIADGGTAYAERIPDGKWYTTGDPVNMLQATLAYAQKDLRYQPAVGLL
jgi:UTP--glucose-1-phosphate uridylyltransferase